jgi:hypothetical protein
MAKLVTYKGTSRIISRFGMVKTGQQLHLRETEWAHVKGDPEFELVKEKGGQPEQVQLKDTLQFKFTQLPFGTERIYRAVRRKGRKQLRKMAVGMETLGIPCVTSSDMNREQLADVILESAGAAGWLPD